MASNTLTIPRMLAHSAQRHGERIAIEENGVAITYAQLHRNALKVAAGLIALGVEPGDRVAIWAPNGSQWIVAALGIHCAGAALVPVNTRMKGSEAGYVLASSGARVLFSAGQFLGSHYPELLAEHRPSSLAQIVVLNDARPVELSWENFLDKAQEIDDAVAFQRAAAVTPDMLSDVMFTSGTTGNPKGVMTAHGQNLKAIDGWAQAMGLCAEDRYLIVNPFFHAMGYKAGWLAALMHGATILPQQVFDTTAVLKAIERDRISVLPGPPTVFHSLLADPALATTDLSSLRATITGSTTIPPSLIERMRNELGFKVVLTGYGLTESCGFATLTSRDDSPQVVAHSCGRAMPGVELRIVDEHDREVEPGTAGEVLIRGYNVMQGYFSDDAATREVVDTEGWLHTGDIGLLDEAGCLRITDRLKDMYIVGGFNCYPAEIERLIAAHSAVAQVAIVGVLDDRMGEVGRAFVVLRPGALMNGEEFIAWCRTNMSNYKVPRYVDFVDSLPTNPSGKVLKRELRSVALAQVS
ncbi:FadD3 family acyl-CoA ligase [Pseudomonas sp. PDM28]|uniref:FadD3 family acyl-CoA ligase n=1 Tax=Pseudomonas sp. PDM28 TaxID=2854770 RepID=UPI001C478E85|nr:FadD3 family acyl-CoA ligase [Pseudomonas sp. PDM28]MBV7551476.1 FadD3 family acyl-CoA ligase [Pseudomonas sp. PDM28]